MSVIIKFRRGNSSEWISSGSTVLASGEPGFELDTGRFKIGDGITAWSGLYYASIVPTGFISGSGIDIDLGTNGSYATISVTGFSLIGHTHSSSDITDFNSAVSGLLPVKNIVGGTGIYVTSTTGNYTIGISGNILISGLNADLLDGQHGSYYLDWTNTTNKPSPIITGILTGDVAGTGSVTLSQLSNGTLTINSTIQPNSVALGTDTTGNYVSLVSVSGTGLSISGSAGEGSTFTVVSNATPANSGGTIISRDSNGNFYATTGNLDVLYFNTNIEPTLLQGQMAWNDTEGTVDVALTDTTIINVGEHEIYRVRNTSGGILYKGQAVMATGVHSNGIIIPNLYTANGSVREIRFMGLVYENINDNNNGYVIHFGHINNIDTRGNVASNIAVGDETWADGDTLYVHPTVAGKLTKNEPKHSISVAIILDAASNGKIFVRPISYGHLGDNHDVSVSGATNGQFLQYNSSTDYWVPSSSGNFTTLLVNGTGVSVSGHTHTASQITDFNEAVDDRIGSGLFVAGTGINLSYNDGSNSFTVSVTGLIANPSGNRILTSRDNTTTGIDAESNLTFDGTTLVCSGNARIGDVQYIDVNNGNIYIKNPDGSLVADFEEKSLFGDSNIKSIEFGSRSLVDSSGTSTLYWYTPSRIGILNDTPSYTLDVNGSGNFASGLAVANQTASTIASFDSNKNVVSLSTGTYPSLTELSYVKGVTSAIQTQLNNKQNTLTNPVTGTGIANHIAYWNSSSGIVADSGQLYWDATNNRLGVGTASPSSSLTVSGIIQLTDTAGNRVQFFRGGGTQYDYSMSKEGNHLAISTANDGSTFRYTQFGYHSGATWTPTTVINNYNGYVGIGTTTPTAHLQVVGTGRFTNIDINNSAIAGSSALTVNGSISTQSQGIIAGQFSAYGDQNTRLYKPDSTTFAMSSANSGIKQSFGYLVSSTHTPWMTITNSGVGIGITTPSGQLHVIGTGNFSQNLLVNGVSVSVSGHTHTSSDITNFNASVSGLLPTISNSGDNRILTSTGTTTGINAESNATFDGTTLAVSGAITVDNLKLDGNTLSSTNANGNIIIQPSGYGALQRDSGGNTRGQYAVDWQTIRSTGSMIAAGYYSVIGGGYNNTATGWSTVVAGGQNNNAIYGAIVGGRNNTTNGGWAFVGGGAQNSANNERAVVCGGYNNTSNGYNSFIGGGKNNNITNLGSLSEGVICGGQNNIVSGLYGVVGGGYNNYIYSLDSAILGGRNNTTNHTNTFILGSNITSTQADTTYVQNLDVSVTGDIDTLRINKFYHNNLSVATGVADSSLLITIVDPTGTPSTQVISGSGLRNSLLNQPAVLRFRQGTNAERLLITPASGEPIWTTDTQKFYIGDGSTVGGDFIGPSPYDRSSGTQSITALNTSCIASGEYSAVLAGSSCGINSNSDFGIIVGGFVNTITNAKYAIIGGGYGHTISHTSSQYTYSSIFGGIGNTITNSNSAFIGGGYSNAITGHYAVICGGGNDNEMGNSASGYSSAIVGGASNTTTGQYSFVGGGYNNYNSGTNATIAGGTLNIASGLNSVIAGGTTNTCGGQSASIGGGSTNIASGQNAMVGGGSTNTASGSSSVVGGGSTNSATALASIVPGGFRAKASRYGELSHAAGYFAAVGDAQHTILTARKTTTDATANQVLFLDNSSARLTLPAETTWTFSIKLSAYNDTDNQGAWWIFRGGIRRNAANGTALIGSLITESGFESSFNTASVSVVADDTNEALEIRVTGVASKNIRWVAVVDISQVSYGTP